MAVEKLKIILVSIFLSACNAPKPTDTVAYIKTGPITLDSLKRYELVLHAGHTDQESSPAKVEEGINKGIRIGLFYPNDTTCGETLPVYPLVTFDRSRITNCAKDTDDTRALLALTKALYELIPEEKEYQEHSYDLNGISYNNLLDSLETGAWKYMCDGHAAVVKKILNELNKKYIVKLGYLDADSGDEITHTIALVYFNKNQKWYGTSIDCQNGVIGPLSSGSKQILQIDGKGGSINKNDTAGYTMVALDDAILHKKRTLMDEPLPCNLYPDKASKYHKAHPQSGYKLERLSYSQLQYTMFQKKGINVSRYSLNILNLLEKNL